MCSCGERDITSQEDQGYVNALDNDLTASLASVRTGLTRVLRRADLSLTFQPQTTCLLPQSCRSHFLLCSVRQPAVYQFLIRAQIKIFTIGDEVCPLL